MSSVKCSMYSFLVNSIFPKTQDFIDLSEKYWLLTHKYVTFENIVELEGLLENIEFHLKMKNISEKEEKDPMSSSRRAILPEPNEFSGDQFISDCY